MDELESLDTRIKAGQTSVPQPRRQQPQPLISTNLPTTTWQYGQVTLPPQQLASHQATQLQHLQQQHLKGGGYGVSLGADPFDVSSLADVSQWSKTTGGGAVVVQQASAPQSHLPGISDDYKPFTLSGSKGLAYDKHALVAPTQASSDTSQPPHDRPSFLYPQPQPAANQAPPPPPSTQHAPSSMPSAPIAPPPFIPTGPMEVELSQYDPPSPIPDYSAHSHSHSCDVPGQLTKRTDASGKVVLRDVYISTAIMREFLAYARSNTRKGIETCADLAAVLDVKHDCFVINTMVITKQKGSSDQVERLNEEELIPIFFDPDREQPLYQMGWIHSHPTQTCFLSSIDVHTQYNFQHDMGEAIAIVMAPTDPKRKMGVFRLSTPGGLDLIANCQERGFHPHPRTHTGQEIYEVVQHVFVDETVKPKVIDLR